jgi:hypothetical protein
MSARTTRIRLFAASTVALAALALTACENGTDEGSAAPTATTEAVASPDPQQETADSGEATGQDATGTDTDTAKTDDAPTARTDKSAAAATSTKPGKCSAAAVKITATEVPRPINHLLLTATNTGSKTCYLPAYPMARFGEAQAVPPVVEASQPQAVTTLEPGKSGYAGVLTSAADGSGGDGYTAKTLTVPFDNGSIATVALPADGVYVDSSLKVTYWLTSMDQALGY